MPLESVTTTPSSSAPRMERGGLSEGSMPATPSASSLTKDALFSLRIVAMDHVSVEPHPSGLVDRLYSAFHPNIPLPKVPILRIFGTTKGGQRAMVRVHHLFPYMYIPYDGPVDNSGALQTYIKQLAASIHHALAASLNKNPDPRRNQFIVAILPVRGLPFYGFHTAYSTFLKIYLVDPWHIPKLVDLFRSKAIMNAVIQPFEAHVQFSLQFLLDFNLYGMDYLHASFLKLRTPFLPRDDTSMVALSSPILPSQQPWTQSTVNPDLLWHEGWQEHFGRESFCELEGDLWPWHILNRRLAPERRADPWQPTLATERITQLVPSLEAVYDDELRRRERLGLDAKDVRVDRAKERSDARSSPEWANFTHLQSLIRKYVAQSGASTAEKKMEVPLKPAEIGLEGMKEAYESLSYIWPDPDHWYRALHAPRSILSTMTYREAWETTPAWFQPFLAKDRPANAALNKKEFVDEEDVIVNEAALTQLTQKFAHEALHANKLVSPRKVPVGTIDDDAELGADENESADVEEGVRLIPAPSAALSQDATETAELLAKLRQEEILPEKASPRKRRSFISTIDVPSIPASLRQQESKLKSVSRPTIRSLEQKGDSPRHVHFVMTNDEPFRPPAVQIEGPPPKRARHDPDASSDVTLAQTEMPPVTPTSHQSAASQFWRLRQAPPSAMDVEETCQEPFQKPYFSAIKDIPSRPILFGGREFRFQKPFAQLLQQAPPSDPMVSNVVRTMPSVIETVPASMTWTLADPAPLPRQVAGTPSAPKKNRRRLASGMHRVEATTPKLTFGFKFSQPAQNKMKTALDAMSFDWLRLLNLELFCCSRGDFLPDPQVDPIDAIVYGFYENGAIPSLNGKGHQIGIIYVRSDTKDAFHYGIAGKGHLHEVATEEDAILQVIHLVRAMDPEILAGYEIHKSSWGIKRDELTNQAGIDLCPQLSRVPMQATNRHAKEDDTWGYQHASSLHISGRIVLNTWRLMRAELNLTMYSFQNVVYHILHTRVPKFDARVLTTWWQQGHCHRWKVMDYLMDLCLKGIFLLDQTGVVQRTSEFARLYGIEFFQVLSRGSQFKVESIMFRIAKPENFVLITPSRQQVADMRAIECLPLVMEPRSAFYESPVAVLDFTSLYPSIMIAYNYCFSTCLGRISTDKNKSMGFTTLPVAPELMKSLQEDMHLSPNGVAFVKPHVRESVLAKMLLELLETRAMVKASMKKYQSDKTLLRLMEARQLGLKLLANVTYGYTSASFSGRMPCVDIADAIVQTARETLEKAIALIHETKRWRAEVVYGDTDSLFIHFPGSTRARAFRVAKEIAAVVTSNNPHPMKLKFEKIYHPCVLMSKKRYVGYKYEDLSQKEPVFDAKGIETVRRDGCPAVSRMLESVLRTLFETADLSKVKRYTQIEFNKMLADDVNYKDFIFAKEVKLGTYVPGHEPPGALISIQKKERDARAEPEHGERVPYVVVYGYEGQRVMDQITTPEDVTESPKLRINSEYYITRQIIPTLARVLNLCGGDIAAWWQESAKSYRVGRNVQTTIMAAPAAQQQKQKQKATFGAKSLTLDQFYQSNTCVVCANSTAKRRVQLTASEEAPAEAYSLGPMGNLCATCASQPMQTLMTLQSEAQERERRYNALLTLCGTCAGRDASFAEVPSSATGGEEEVDPIAERIRCDNPCRSVECDLYFERWRSRRRMEAAGMAALTVKEWLKWQMDISSQG